MVGTYLHKANLRENTRGRQLEVGEDFLFSFFTTTKQNVGQSLALHYFIKDVHLWIEIVNAPLPFNIENIHI